jgi:arsenate reductase
MTDTTLYGIRNCDTMKKARAWLDAAGVAYRFHDYRTDGLEAVMLDRWIARVGWERLLNRSGSTFRKVVPEPERATIDVDRARALMRAWPAMVRRPVLEIGEHLLVGFDGQAYARMLTSAGRARYARATLADQDVQ